MSKYAYIPLGYAAHFMSAYPAAVPIYTSSHIHGVEPCLADSNGNSMPNVLLLEAEDFSPELREYIVSTTGLVFEDAAAYHVYVQQMMEAQQAEEDDDDDDEVEEKDEFDMLFDDLDDEDSEEEEWDSVGTAPDPEIDVPLDAEQPAAEQPDSNTDKAA